MCSSREAYTRKASALHFARKLAWDIESATEADLAARIWALASRLTSEPTDRGYPVSLGKDYMSLKATEVFVPGAYPHHTYVQRSGESIEQSLRDALDTPGQIVSLSGPSKSGKTVLVEKVVGRDSLIPISGASVRSPDEVWTHALDWMDVPSTSSRSYGFDGKVGAELAGKGSIGFKLVAQGEASATAKGELGLDVETETVKERRGLAQIVDEIADSDFVLLIDDFHYMERTVQQEVAKVLKEAVRLGVKIVTASVAHRGDDIVRANPELRGRVRGIVTCC